MYAIVRRNSFRTGHLPGAQAALREFDEIHADQPGFLGTIAIDEPDGRRLVISLWTNEEHATAALPALRTTVARLLQPLMSQPSELIGVGEVIANDLIPDAARGESQR